MTSALFVSPHLDDVVFSCGGTLATLARRGWTTTLCTIFTRSLPNPSGFALACQLDKGLAATVDYLALRRAEDRAAAHALGVTFVEHLDYAEAPHRGYDDAAALFGPYVPRDRAATAIEEALASCFASFDAIFVPQALGDHVDHRRVRDAALRAAAQAGARDRLIWYQDMPYAVRRPDAVPERALAEAFTVHVEIALGDEALAAKLDACARYVTQVPFQFGSELLLRSTLGALPFERFRTRSPASAFWAS